MVAYKVIYFAIKYMTILIPLNMTILIGLFSIIPLFQVYLVSVQL